MSSGVQQFVISAEEEVASWNVTVSDDKVAAKYGFRNYEFPIDKLRYVYTDLSQSVEDAKGSKLGLDTGAVVLCYEDPEKDKLRHVNMNADRDCTQARGLVEAVLSLRPDTDIRDMERKEAFELMEARDYTRMGIMAGIVTAVVIVVAVTLFALFGEGL